MPFLTDLLPLSRASPRSTPAHPDRPPSPVNVTVTQLKANSATVSWDVPEGDVVIGYAILQQVCPRGSLWPHRDAAEPGAGPPQGWRIAWEGRSEGTALSRALQAGCSWDQLPGDDSSSLWQRQDGQMQRFIREVNTTNRACVLWDLAEDADYIIQVQSIGLYGESQASKRVHFRTLKETDRLPSNSSNQGEGIAQVPPVGPSPFHFVSTLCLLPGGCLNAGCESKRDDVQHGSLQKAVGCVPSSQSTFVCQGEVGLSLWLLRSLNDAGHEVGSAGRVNAASPARLLFSVGDITMEGLDKDRQLQTGEIIIIVAVLLMWAGECH